jgi:hypothetical protein
MKTDKDRQIRYYSDELRSQNISILVAFLIGVVLAICLHIYDAEISAFLKEVYPIEIRFTDYSR